MIQTSELRLERSSFHVLSLHDRRVLLHIPSTGVFNLDSVTSSVLNFGKEGETISPEAVLEALSSAYPESDIRGAIDDLTQLGILREAVADRAEERNVPVREFPLSTIVLNVNTGCNLSCSYCYKEDLDTHSQGKKLSFDKAAKAIELLIKEGRSRDRLNVIFFGGEPLSNMALIRQVTEYAELRSAQEGKSVDFSLTTNATLLTPEIISYLNDHKFGISISMDGPQAVHDRHRRTIGGQGTYDVVAAKAKLLLSSNTAKPVGARVTVTAGYSNVKAIHEHLKEELGFAEVGIAPVTSNPVHAFNLSGGELRVLFESMKKLGREYVAAAIEGRNIGFSNMHQLMSDLYEGRKKSLPCGAGVGLLAVDHNGDLNLCHRFTGSQLPAFGNVEDGISKLELGSFIEKAIDRSDRGCTACRIRNLCSGGCYHESYANFSDPHSPVHHYCDLLREWVDFGIECYLEILEKNPRFLHEHINNRRVEL